MTGLARLLRRIAITVVGAALLAVGVALLFAPGPGMLVIVLALAMLAVEYEWARRRLIAARALARSAAERTATNRVAKASAVMFSVGAIGLGGMLIFTDILPFSGIGTGASVVLAGLIVLATTAWGIRDARRAQAASEADGRAARTSLDRPRHTLRASVRSVAYHGAMNRSSCVAWWPS